MYDVDFSNDQFTISLNGQLILRFTEGNTLLIAATYANLNRTDHERGQDFLHGVLMGFNHVAMTDVVPRVVPTI